MSRLELFTPSKDQLMVESLYKNLEQRIVASPPGICPVDITRAFIEMCHAQTCGKCVPCRVGLHQLKHMITNVLNGDADYEILDLIEETSLSIMQTADCAIGSEAAKMVWRMVHTCRDDFEAHIRNKRCSCAISQPVPCVALCPAHVDIPGYIALVREGRYADAIQLIRKDNPFPSTCGFICEHPCEARCRRNMVDTSVNIRGLKRAAADLAGKVAPPPCGPSTGKKIAVVGGGPSGLSSAYYLQLMGHQVTVYEMLPKLGGMLRYGIPNYRLPKDRLEEDTDAILETGIQVHYNVKIGEDIKLDELRKVYDAVLITVGASTDKKLGLPNEDAEGITSAVGFLRNVSLGNCPDLTGQEVAVIGGGNVSMDAVRTAIRLGAKKVSIVYRRRVADMTALPAEIEAAVAEGVELLTLVAPAGIEVDENGHVSEVVNGIDGRSAPHRLIDENFDVVGHRENVSENLQRQVHRHEWKGQPRKGKRQHRVAAPDRKREAKVAQGRDHKDPDGLRYHYVNQSRDEKQHYVSLQRDAQELEQAGVHQHTQCKENHRVRRQFSRQGYEHVAAAGSEPFACGAVFQFDADREDRCQQRK